MFVRPQRALLCRTSDTSYDPGRPPGSEFDAHPPTVGKRGWCHDAPERSQSSLARGEIMTRRIELIPIVLFVCAGGCATQGPQTTQEMTRAKTLIEQADRAGAQRYAAADLQRAHDQFSNAERANGEKKYD